jgi:hypothetical protein
VTHLLRAILRSGRRAGFPRSGIIFDAVTPEQAGKAFAPQI